MKKCAKDIFLEEDQVVFEVESSVYGIKGVFSERAALDFWGTICYDSSGCRMTSPS